MSLPGSTFRFALAAAAFLVLRGVLFHVSALYEVAPGASAWYPPAGLTFAFVLYGGLPALPFALIPSGLLATGGLSEFDLLVIPQALCLGGAALVLRRRLGDGALATAHGVASFVVVAIVAVTLLFVLSTLLAAAITHSHVPDFPDLPFAFWLGDLSGVLLGAPVFAALFRRLGGVAPPEDRSWRPLHGGTALWALALSLAALAVWAVFHRALSTPGTTFFLLMIPIAIAALARGFGAATLTAFLTNVGLVLAARGILEVSDAADLQVFTLAAGAAGLLLGALGSARAELANRNGQLVSAMTETPIGVAILERGTDGVRASFANPAFRSLVRDPAALGIQAFLTGAGFEGDVTVDAESDEPRVLNLTVRPAGADREAFVAVARDVTEQRRREAVEEHHQRMVAMGEMVGGVAHELNNVLHPILNLSRQARQDIDARPDRLPAHLRIVEESAQSAAAIVRQVLAFARGEAAEPGGTELVSAVADAVAFARSTVAPSFRIRFTTDVESARTSLSRTEVGQIVANLVVNAHDATGRRGEIRIRLCPGRDGAAATLDVEDDGPGVPFAIAPHVFKPFYTTKPHGQGTGLGLAMVRNILARRGGDILLATESPQPARFLITFPK